MNRVDVDIMFMEFLASLCFIFLKSTCLMFSFYRDCNLVVYNSLVVSVLAN